MPEHSEDKEKTHAVVYLTHTKSDERLNLCPELVKKCRLFTITSII